jgi:hypothetical protein
VSVRRLLGSLRRRAALGDEYLEALFKTSDMSEGCDFVMYWWSYGNSSSLDKEEYYRLG